MKINIPVDVNTLLDELEKHGFEAYVVGGCVRDSIMRRHPHDWDICTSAKPDDMIEIFKDYHVIPTGLQHGTITVVLNHVGYEITTYRIDGEYTDYRRPDHVEFTEILAQDLMRRDFTMNAIAYSPKHGLIDLFDGVSDIQSCVLRCVGNAAARFQEDALRILRAIRFCAQLEFQPDAEVRLEINNHKHLLDHVSKERIQSEFMKILACKSSVIQLSMFPHVFGQIIPQIRDMIDFPQHNPYHQYDVWNHTLHALVHTSDRDIVTRLAVLFHDIGKPHCYQDDENGIRHFKGHGRVSADITDSILRDLRYDNSTRESVVQLVYYHDATFEVGDKYVRRWINKIGEMQFLRLLDVRYADIQGQSDVNQSDRLDKVKKIRECYHRVMSEPACFTLKDLAINGKDLIALGFKPGKQIGYILDTLLKEVIDGEIANDKDVLIHEIDSIK